MITSVSFICLGEELGANVGIDLQEDLDMIRKRLADEAFVASRFGTGPWALFRGAVSELTRKGMRNRVLLVFCSFALQNMSGAAGKLTTTFLHSTPND